MADKTRQIPGPSTGGTLREIAFFGRRDRIPEFGREEADQFIGVTNLVNRV